MNSNIKTYTPSVNILRDYEKSLLYIPTENSNHAFKQIVSSKEIGTKSFCIIGAYGTGKSAFLLALEKSIKQKTTYFDPARLSNNGFMDFEIFNVIGDFTSISRIFIKKIYSSYREDISTENIVKQLNRYYKKIEEQGKGLLIVIDEFGKFLEYASKENTEFEMYFIQQLAEFANDASKNVILLTTLHQSFSSYAFGLSIAQQNEWSKTQGRLLEITFNEPVEQLLLLAAARISQENYPQKKKDSQIKAIVSTIRDAKVFPLRENLTEDIARKLYPLDILAAAVMTKALQEYGQNQRSLFTFIETGEFLGINDYDSRSNPFYNLSCVYDYLSFNYHSFLSSKFNPHFSLWSAIRIGIERVNNLFDELSNDALKIVKTIGLLNIFGLAGSKIDSNFLINYCIHAIGIDNAGEIINHLEKKQIIRFRKFNESYILFEGTDLDLEKELQEAGSKLQLQTTIVSYLERYFDFPVIPVKKYFFKTGTPRFFIFKLTDEPIISIKNDGKSDGVINLIFNELVDENAIKEASGISNDAILYGYYKDSSQLLNLINEIEKTNYVIENNKEDRVALKELDVLLNNSIEELNGLIKKTTQIDNSLTSWYYKGRLRKLDNSKQFHELLTQICEDVYKHTPQLKNELFNKNRLSSSITVAKRNLIKNIFDNFSKEDLGLAKDKYPAEKAIYFSLLKATGIHRIENGNFNFHDPTDKSFTGIWEVSEEFLRETKYGKRNLTDLIEILKSKPFKLKQGFIDIWMPIYLFIKRERIAIYGKEGFLPVLSSESLEIITRRPKEYKIKVYDLEGERLAFFNNYRKILNQIEHEKPGNESFLETIRPFIVFYKELTQYAKKTKNISETAINLRSAIESAKDPEELFFEQIPSALGFKLEDFDKRADILEEFTITLKSCIDELRMAQRKLINDIESFICNEIIGERLSFENYKNLLIKRYTKLREYELNPRQKSFHLRIISALDDRDAWLNSLSLIACGKSFEILEDHEISLLKKNLRDLFHELDNLCDLNLDEINQEMEEVLKLEVTSMVAGVKNRIIRLPKSKMRKVEKLVENLNSQLTDDNVMNLAILTKIIEKQLNEE